MRALLFVPILMGCALVAGGFSSDSSTMIGVGFGMAGTALVIALALKISDVSAANAERRRIWKNGRVAAARVIAIAEAPGSGDENPEVDLDLELRGEGAPAARVKVRSLISRLAVPRVQPGCEIEVRVDPADGTKILIDPRLTPYRMD